MAESDLETFYQELYGRPLAEPTTEQDVKNILSCIRAQHGFLDSDDENQLRTATTPVLQKKLHMITSYSRKVLGGVTKL